MPVYHAAMDRDALTSLIERLPEELRREVLDYAHYLLERKAPKDRLEREPNLHHGDMTMHDDFDAPLPDEFWLGE